jgi:hypothetical protein
MAGPRSDARLRGFLFGTSRGRGARRVRGFGQAAVLLAGILVPELMAAPVSATTPPASAPLTVAKQCAPASDGGTFNLRVDGHTVLANAACGRSVTVSVAAGSRHTVSETAGTGTSLATYAATFSTNCANGTISLAPNTAATCTITNTRETTLTVTKVCVPTSDPGHFNLRVDGSTVLAAAACGRSTTVTVTPGVVHSVSETAGANTSLASYTPLIGGACAADGTVTLAVGAAATCMITNSRIPPATASLTVTKACLPTTDGGTFNLRVDGKTVLAGATCTGATSTITVSVAVGTHTVGETTAGATTLASYRALIGGDCAASGIVTLSAGQIATCTITNTRLPTLTVTKLCVPDPNPGSFDILVDGVDRGDVSCAQGGSRTIRTVVLGAGPHAVGERADGTTSLSAYAATYACTNGTIDPFSGAITLAAGQNATCTITNTLDSTFTVSKVWSDGPSGHTAVSIGLTCGAGTVAMTPLSASPGSPAVFSVTGVPAGGTSCTATEQPVAGYTPDAGCAAVSLAAGGTPSCTITNTLSSSTVTVTEVWSPSSNSTATIHLACDQGTVKNNDLTAPPDAIFTVTGLPTGGTTCSATEPSVPAGYTESDNCGTISLVPGGTPSCTITNTLNTGDFTVHKVWSPTSNATATIHLACDLGTVTNNDLTALPDAVFTVTGFPTGGTSCSATEPSVPAGYTESDDCSGVALTPLSTAGNGCTITNTLNTATFTVSKVWSGPNLGLVSFHLACLAGVVTNPDLNAGSGSPAMFTVTGFPTGGTTCTATEPSVPAGYTETDDCSGVALDLLTTSGNACTITNTLSTATFTVSKVWSGPDLGPVSFHLACVAGTVTNPDLNAGTGSPALFTVTGIPAGGTTCTATEPSDFAGYTESDDCSGVLLDPLSTGGNACTITNRLSTATFTVSKVWSDNSTGTVSIYLGCQAGTVSNHLLDAGPGSPAVFTVTGIPAGGTTCTAYEPSVPFGYTSAHSCSGVHLDPISTGGNACTITNTLLGTLFFVNDPSHTGLYWGFLTGSGLKPAANVYYCDPLDSSCFLIDGYFPDDNGNLLPADGVVPCHGPSSAYIKTLRKNGAEIDSAIVSNPCSP